MLRHQSSALKQALLILCFLLIHSCGSAPEHSKTSSAPTYDPAKESTNIAEDTSKYKGFKCGDFRLGTSLAQFKQDAAKQGVDLAEDTSNYPGLIRRFRVYAPGPVKGMTWEPYAKFVDDGRVYRLYAIEGFVTSSDGDVVRKLSQKLGKSKVEGLAHKWIRGGTKVRLISGDGYPLLSFTHDEVSDIAGEKMAEAIDSGRYRK